MTFSRATKSSRTHVGLEQRFVASARSIPVDIGLKMVVGFSGGPDSLALALLIARTMDHTGIDALLVHVDHRIRPESSVEADRAKRLANKVELPFKSVKLRPNLQVRHRGVGTEEAARRERFEQLAIAANQKDTKIISLAHHNRDQAETVLLHLLRGAGLTGSGGMAKQDVLNIPWWRSVSEPRIYMIWRPLLEEDPADLAAYVESFGLEPITDPSNSDLSIRRNAVRHCILPELEQFQPGATKALARFGLIVSDEDLFLVQLMLEARAKIADGRTMLNRELLKLESSAIAKRLIRYQAGLAGDPSPSFDRVEHVRDLIHAEPTDRVIQISRNCIAVSDNEWVYVGTLADVWTDIEEANHVLLAPQSWDSRTEIKVKLGKATSKDKIRVSSGELSAKLGSGIYPAIPMAALDEHLVLRMLKPGDRWARSGQKLREWLRVAGVPPIARRRVLVVASGDRVWWAPTIQRPEPDAPQPGEQVFYVNIE